MTANIIGVKNEMEAAGVSEFAKSDEKVDLADRQIACFIKKVEPKVDTQFGDQTMYHVISEKFGKDETGQPITKILAFTHSEYRESKARNIKAAMDAAPGQLAGPVYLGRYRTRNGHDAWELYAEPQPTRSASDPIASVQSSTPAPAPTPAQADSDIPF